jgi:hypothetical protein
VLQPLARNRLALSRLGAFLQALEDVQGSSYVCQLLGHGKLLCRDQQERTFIAMQACGRYVSAKTMSSRFRSTASR